MCRLYGHLHRWWWFVIHHPRPHRLHLYISILQRPPNISKHVPLHVNELATYNRQSTANVCSTNAIESSVDTRCVRQLLTDNDRYWLLSGYWLFSHCEECRCRTRVLRVTNHSLVINASSSPRALWVLKPFTTSTNTPPSPSHTSSANILLITQPHPNNNVNQTYLTLTSHTNHPHHPRTTLPHSYHTNHPYRTHHIRTLLVPHTPTAIATLTTTLYTITLPCDLY